MSTGLAPGSTAVQRAAWLAGALAELGVTRLRLRQPGGATEQLAARRTDLPGVIAAAPEGSELECDEPAVRVGLGPSALRWESADARAIQALSRGG